MCGISAEARFDGERADLSAVSRMTAEMASRGPDGEGTWNDGWVALGHRRLSIIDLSDAGAQPMVAPELGLSIVFNGCIYNHRELRRELERVGHVFRSTSDTEVVLRAYDCWGEAFVDRLVGMFAIVLVDQRRHRLVLVRDRLGIKPLYLAETPRRLRVASSLPALLAGGDVDTEIDPVGLHHYLTWHSIVPAPRTLLRGVRKLPPATVRVVERDGRAREWVYWRPDYVRDPARSSMSSRDWEDVLEAALRVAVERRTVADVPVGVLLSGGVDSSVIVAMLAETGCTDLQTFSIGFDAAGGEDGDEFRYSDLVAQRFGTDHHRIRIRTPDLVPAVDATIGAMTEPMGSHDVVAFHLLSREVAKHVKVVQSGQGADEVFGGYHFYQPLAGIARDGAAAAFRDAFFDRAHDELADLVAPEYLTSYDVSGEFAERAMQAPGADTALDAVLRFDVHGLMVDDPVKRVDSMTMAWGLEARVPFLDHDLVTLAAQCPPELKLADGGKGVLKAIARRLVPPEVVDRPKGYFPVPGVKHLDEAMVRFIRDALEAPAAKERGIFRRDAIDRLLASPNGQFTPNRSNVLWQLGLLELWLQRHVDSEAHR